MGTFLCIDILLEEGSDQSVQWTFCDGGRVLCFHSYGATSPRWPLGNGDVALPQKEIFTVI